MLSVNVCALLMLFAAAQVSSIEFSENYCYQPIQLENGGYNPVENEYPLGQTIEYYCDEGYEIQGVATSECKYNVKSGKASFTGSPPACKRTVITCPDLVDPMHGSIYVSGYTLDSSARYECQNGYKLEGNGHRTCQYDGTWSGSEPRCILSECPYLENPSNGYVAVKGQTPGSEAHYDCDDGFKLLGVAYRTCMDDCTWSAEAPICEQIKCPRLPPPKHGSLKTYGRIPGKTAHYGCYVGYKLTGEAYRTCEYTGLWSGEEPTCRPATCPHLENPEYGYVYTEKERLFGSEARYACYPGYKLVGPARRKCLEDCKWSKEAPKCTPHTCRDHTTLFKNGIVTYSNGLTRGSRAHYQCNSGYKLEGLSYRTCGYNGIWSGKRPQCNPAKCSKLTPPPNGAVHVPAYSPGSYAYYTCKGGYKVVGNAYRKCQDNCKWEGKRPSCEPIECPFPEGLPHGRAVYTGYTPGKVINYRCNAGYKLVGVARRRCNYDGKWSGELPECILSVCPSLADIEHGYVLVPDYKKGSKAHYNCDKGYRLVGEEYRTCKSNCKWSGEPPKCVLIKCDPLPTPSFGSLHVSGYTVGSTAEYTCTYGYRLVGEYTRTCQYDETWSGVDPVCELIICPELTHPENGKVYTNIRKVGAEAIYTCNYGYHLIGEEKRRCEGDGYWSGAEPYCEYTKTH